MIISSAKDYRAAAKAKVPPFLFHYADGGAYDEYTLKRNSEDLAQIALRQRILRNMSSLSPETQLFGETLSMPVALAPVGLCGMYARRGEVQAARAADKKVFLLPSPPCRSARLKKWRRRCSARCGSSFTCCATAALCVTCWSGHRRQAARRWCSPSICRCRGALPRRALRHERPERGDAPLYPVGVLSAVGVGRRHLWPSARSRQYLRLSRRADSPKITSAGWAITSTRRSRGAIWSGFATSGKGR